MCNRADCLGMAEAAHKPPVEQLTMLPFVFTAASQALMNDGTCWLRLICGR
jgi:hypothetical protein